MPAPRSNRQALLGPANRFFADRRAGAPRGSFQMLDTSSRAYKSSSYHAVDSSQLEPIPVPSPAAPMTLESVLGAAFLAPIEARKKITFHAVGDTGASTPGALQSEDSVSAAMVQDLEGDPALVPAFFFHLGDVVYYFGEGSDYYAQFFRPFQTYDRPILAIPGNHDGVVNPSAAAPTLAAFMRNFCAPTAGPSPDSGSIIRSTMTQPGVYFTLDAPCVSIVGLYTNVLEGPGVISSQRGTYPTLNDDQLTWLRAELTRLRPLRESGDRAVILACHHPPASAELMHGAASGFVRDLDDSFAASNLYPDAILSGHSHLYQRFTRVTAGVEIPYVVSGSGGHEALMPSGETGVKAPLTFGEYTLEVGPVAHFGYLVLTVDMSAPNGSTLAIDFKCPSDPALNDGVTIDLGKRVIL